MKLQSKILLLLIPVIVIPMIALGWGAYQQLRSTAQEKTFAQMSSLLNQIDSLHHSNLNIGKSNIELFANSSLIKRYLRTSNLQDRYTLLQPSLLQLFASYQQAFPQYYDIRIILPNGTEDTRSSLPAAIDKQQWQPKLFEQMSSSTSNIYSQYLRHNEDKELALFISKRIELIDQYFEPSLASPKLRAYITILADLKILRQQIINEGVGKTGYMFLTNGQGIIVMHPEQAERFMTIPTELFQRLQQVSVTGNYVKGFYQGQDFIFKSKQINADLWAFAVLPELEFIAASHKLGMLVASVLLMTIILTSSLILILLKFLIIKPISNLQDAAQEIANGHFGASINYKSNDEIGDLSHSFNEMSLSLQKSNKQIQHIAYHDSLTGLPNRRMFIERLNKTLLYSQLHHQKFTLLFLDLDNFKRVNDTQGHDVGDELLKDFSQRLTGCLRSGDYLADFKDHDKAGCVSRVGGDEFIFLLQDIDEKPLAQLVAKRIIDIATQPFIIREHEFHIGASIGITLYPNDGDNIDQLIKNADIAMYAAKAKGKNNFQFYHPSMNAEVMEQLSLENELRKAIPDQQLRLFYQPKVNIHTGELVGTEALVRWQHPRLGLLDPGKFIPLAESTGLIEPLGEWVINEACKQNKSWQSQGLLPISIAVNISNKQFDKHDLLIVVEEALKQTGLNAKYLELELTETSIMQAEASVMATLMAIKALGVTIAMDDFGTGYSSLSILRHVSIDCIKIDRGFIKNLAHNNDDAAIVFAIITMAKNLGIQVVAEGIENGKQLEVLLDQGCDVIQGYLISKPIPADEMSLLFNKKVHFPLLSVRTG